MTEPTPCRSCNNSKMQRVISFEPSPLTAKLIPLEAVDPIDPVFDLDLDFCPECSLFQIRHVPPPQAIFDSDYPYFSSTSATLTRQSEEFATRMIGDLELHHDSLVIEIASNDGYLLRHFARHQIKTVGIDPAPEPAAIAQKMGLHTINNFFAKPLAAELAVRFGQADFVIANNVLAHVPDLNGFMQGIKLLLKPSGLVSVEIGYAMDMFSCAKFDAIYHEHHSYFTLHALLNLFVRNGLAIQSVEHIDTQGGSLRVFARHTNSKDDKVSNGVKDLLDMEISNGLFDGTLINDFSNAVGEVKNKLVQLLQNIVADGKTIAAYGAAAKGVMLLNSIGADAKLIKYVVDKNEYKQNKLMPGSRIPIVAPDHMINNLPDYLLILSWNLRDEIISQQALFINSGGKLILPFPNLQIFPPEKS